MTSEYPKTLPMNLVSDYMNAKADAERVKSVAELRRSVRPSFAPSGITGLDLEINDHIALFEIGDTQGKYFGILLRFVIAGLRNLDRDEAVVLELSSSRDRISAVSDIEKIMDSSVSSNLDVRDWDRNSGDYVLGHFSTPGMWQAIYDQYDALQGVDRPTFRCASEDCSLFVRWLDNAYEYLRYEAELPSDLGRLLPGNFLQMCTFRENGLIDLAGEQDIALRKSVAVILATHNRVIVVSDSEVLFDDEARQYLRQRYRVTPLRYNLQRIRSGTAFLRARYSPFRYRSFDLRK